MLLALGLRDFVIVEQMEIAFGAGLTVLTGETGAGKSILVDALSLVLGERADAAVVREGASRAEVSAEFDIAALAALQAWLAENDFDDDQRCILRRTVDANGRSRCFINGRAATAQQLREAGEFLVDLHGQHAHQSLLKQAMQREWLDAYAGASRQAAEVAGYFRRWRQLDEQAATLRRNQDEGAREREQLVWQVEELEALRFDAGEWEALQARHARLANVARLGQAAGAAIDALDGAEVSALALLDTVLGGLEPALALDATLQPVVDLLESARAELHEAEHALRQYADRLDADPAVLAETEQRLDQVVTVARKFRVRPEQLSGCLDDARSRLAALGGSGDVARVEAEAQAARQRWASAAQQLSAVRAAAATRLSAEVTGTMQQLALAGARFEVVLLTTVEGGAFGYEQIEFQVAAHDGGQLRPLSRVASGGELSRIGLALQTAISRVAAVPVLVFDEVDVGIGGKVAETVGRLLQQLATQRQILCITHLPQVAVHGIQHMLVSKRSSAGGVRSHVVEIHGDARVEEIARMLGGATLTTTTRDHAREMLDLAHPSAG